jgi:hypothetical protein
VKSAYSLPTGQIDVVQQPVEKGDDMFSGKTHHSVCACGEPKNVFWLAAACRGLPILSWKILARKIFNPWAWLEKHLANLCNGTKIS